MVKFSMNIVILGAGSIGSYLALALSQEHHNVIVIDHNQKALDKMTRTADIATRHGSGTDWRLLQEIMHLSPHFFIAMSSNDETNLTACAIAKNLGYPETVARIRQKFFLDKSRLDIGKLFSVDHILGTELIIAQDMFKCITNPGHLAVETFADGAVQMCTLVIPETFCDIGKPLSEINLKGDLLIGVIRRRLADGTQKIIFPKGQDRLLGGDEATVIGKTAEMHHLHQLFNIPKKTVHTAVLMGGSGVAIHLTQLLEKQKIKVKIIEHDEHKCAKLARLFPTALVINHDVTDMDFLNEEKVYASDVFVACTESHETNVLAAVLGKQVGCQEVITLVSDESIIPFLQELHISYALSERASIAQRLHVILHDETFLSLASLYNNQAKIMEIKISEHSPLIGIPLANLSHLLPKNLLIAMIESPKGIIIPKGNSKLEVGDVLLILCDSEIAKRIKEIF